MSKRELLPKSFTHLGAKGLSGAKRKLLDERKAKERIKNSDIIKLINTAQRQLIHSKEYHYLIQIANHSAIPRSAKKLDQSNQLLADQLHTALGIIWTNIWNVHDQQERLNPYTRQWIIIGNKKPSPMPTKIGKYMFVKKPYIKRSDAEKENIVENLVSLALARGAMISLCLKYNDLYKEAAVHIGIRNGNLHYGLGHLVQHIDRNRVTHSNIVSPTWFDTPSKLLEFLDRIELHKILNENN